MDFADGAWLGAPSGVITAQNRRKPSYEMLRRLIHEEWNTAEEIRSDENGCLRLQGFRGEYRIEDREGALAGTFRLTSGTDRTEVTLYDL